MTEKQYNLFLAINDIGFKGLQTRPVGYTKAQWFLIDLIWDLLNI